MAPGHEALDGRCRLPDDHDNAELRGDVMGHRDLVRMAIVAGSIAAVSSCASIASSPVPEGHDAFFGVANETTTDAVVRVVGEKGSLNLLVPAGTSARLPDPDATTFGAVIAVHIFARDCHVALASFLDAQTWDLGGRWTITSSGIEPSFAPADATWPIAASTATCGSQPVPKLTPPPAA